MITADHKELNEEQESRMHHKYAKVVQDLATRRIQSYPCKIRSHLRLTSKLLCFFPVAFPCKTQRHWHAARVSAPSMNEDTDGT